jgi:hypothetical protein
LITMWASSFTSISEFKLKFMSRNGIILAVLGGAAAAVLLTNYLQTEKGKQLLSNASDVLKDLTSKATDFAKSHLSNIKTGQEQTTQPS